MEVRNRDELEFFDDTCGKIKELHHSENLSIAYVIVESQAKPHKHLRMEEVYLIEEGTGILYIDLELCRLSVLRG